MLVALALGLGGLSFYFNHDWSGRNKFRIHHRSRPARGRGNAARRSSPSFLPFDGGTLKLTSLKVIPIQEIETNKYPHPIWYLISDSNSVPVESFTYGTPIQGMRPAVPGATPDPLEPGVKYRLLIEAGALKLQDDFEPVARPQ